MIEYLLLLFGGMVAGFVFGIYIARWSIGVIVQDIVDNRSDDEIYNLAKALCLLTHTNFEEWIAENSKKEGKSGTVDICV